MDRHSVCSRCISIISRDCGSFVWQNLATRCDAVPTDNRVLLYHLIRLATLYRFLPRSCRQDCSDTTSRRKCHYCGSPNLGVLTVIITKHVLGRFKFPNGFFLTSEFRTNVLIRTTAWSCLDITSFSTDSSCNFLYGGRSHKM